MFLKGAAARFWQLHFPPVFTVPQSNPLCLLCPCLCPLHNLNNCKIKMSRLLTINPVFASATLSDNSKTYSWLVITFTTNISFRSYRFTKNRCILQLEIVCITKKQKDTSILLYPSIVLFSMIVFISILAVIIIDVWRLFTLLCSWWLRQNVHKK